MFPLWLLLVARGTLAEGLAFPISYNLKLNLKFKMNKRSISRKQGNFGETKTTRLSMLMRTREGATTFLTQHAPFSPHVASQTRIDLVVYIHKKDLHFLNTT